SRNDPRRLPRGDHWEPAVKTEETQEKPEST
ncbi:MAG TPA: RNA pyrophosphohydrolase, partial [Limnobacter sp.]|nr:RNA pyrophosphohydrolase [Limnobacter sp.]